MTDAEAELARRLVAHPRWKWMGGMLDADSRRVDRVDPYDGGVWTDECYWEPTGDRLSAPDLSDPATLGCLEAMLDEARAGKPVRRTPRPPEGLSKGEYRARALLAAWGEP